MGFRDQIVAGLALVREAIQSPNYVAGSAGWAIKRDGTLEAASAELRGTLVATDPVLGTRVTIDNGTIVIGADGITREVVITGAVLSAVPDGALVELAIRNVGEVETLSRVELSQDFYTAGSTINFVADSVQVNGEQLVDWRSILNEAPTVTGGSSGQVLCSSSTKTATRPALVRLSMMALLNIPAAGRAGYVTWQVSEGGGAWANVSGGRIRWHDSSLGPAPMLVPSEVWAEVPADGVSRQYRCLFSVDGGTTGSVRSDSVAFLQWVGL